LLDSSDSALTNSEEKAVGFMLANAGFDVWLGNSRGNKHSKNHTFLNTSSLEFWSFTFMDMSEHDLPAGF